MGSINTLYDQKAWVIDFKNNINYSLIVGNIDDYRIEDIKLVISIPLYDRILNKEITVKKIGNRTFKFYDNNINTVAWVDWEKHCIREYEELKLPNEWMRARIVELHGSYTRCGTTGSEEKDLKLFSEALDIILKNCKIVKK